MLRLTPLCPGALAALGLSLPASSWAEPRPPHAVAQLGTYAALGSPAGWGPTLSLDLLPGSIMERWGIRGEYRGYHGFQQGSILLGALFEAGASRPQLALKLVIEAGLTDAGAPIVGGGTQWSLWVWGPLGLSAISDLQVIIDGSDTRPALSAGLSVHLGK